MTSRTAYFRPLIENTFRKVGLLACLVLFSIGQANGQSIADSLLQLLPKAAADTHKVILLNDIAWELKISDPDRARAFLTQARSLSKEIGYIRGEAQAHNNQGVVEDIDGEYDLAMDHYAQALELRKKLNDHKGIASLYNNIGYILAEKERYTEALANFRESLRIRKRLKDTVRIARVSYSIAAAYEETGDYVSAMDYALTYLSLSERLGLADEIANAHNINGNIKREMEGRERDALDHFLKSVEGYKDLGEDYEIELGQVYLNLGNILGDFAEDHYKNDAFTEAGGEFKEALTYYQRSMDIQVSLDDSMGISDVLNNIGVLFKDQGSYFVELDQNDSAALYFDRAHESFQQSLAIRRSDDDRKGIMEVYNGIGDVYRREEQYEKALDYTYDYLDIARDIENQKYIQSAYKDLARVYNKMEKYKKAYKFRKKYDELRYERLNNQRISLTAQREAVYGDTDKQLEIERQEKEIALRNVALKQAALWRNSLIGGTLGLLLLALLLYNRYRLKNKAATELAEKNTIIERERQRSEDLLLNILPADTARELKLNGQAPAKKYESVSVLFTDFKNFTQIASKMSPEELVAELDECFRAFDEITTRFGIEKIKTIGDSYMCAGGLPQKDADHALRTVEAAFEMQAFMAQMQARQKKEGRPLFESRIGIHTGPVIAGIVGSKKFAYDIWGDTVNLAARMESNGEANRINISRSTYEEVKDYFECQHRGKIQVKNKGEIDMYFVLRTKNKKSSEGAAQKVYRY
ncbi:MAG: adenylate/guanylate cyclase domain-containing protein [Bacteroidota bacterium]